MANKIDNKHKFLSYKYGYHAFFILLIEIVLLISFYISDLSVNEIYQYIFITIGIDNLLIFIILPPLGYFVLRSVISDTINKKTSRLYFVFAPFFTFIYFLNPHVPIMAIPLLIMFWLVFITYLIKLIRPSTTPG